MLASEVLDRAADHIETHGWLQGSMWDYKHSDVHTSPACTVGAVRVQLGCAKSVCSFCPLNPAYRRVLYFADKAMRSIAPARMNDKLNGIMAWTNEERVAWWNDCSATTEEDVVMALRLAARMARCYEAVPTHEDYILAA